MLLIPMNRAEIPGYLRGFSDWYVQALSDAGPGSVDDLQASVAAFLRPQLDEEGVPIGTTVFEIRPEADRPPVGALWAGGVNLGFGPLFYLHDLRIYPPFRGRGHAREALEAVCTIVQQRGGACGVALSVLAGNTVARELYAKNGFKPLSEVLLRTF